MSRFCSQCGQAIEEHPHVRGEEGPIYCEILLVQDVKLPNGETRIVEADSPQRTKENNARWIRLANAPEHLR
jgi:hypothetical protein